MSLGVDFEVSEAQARPSDSLFVLSADLDVELSAPCPAPCLPEGHHAPHHDNTGLTPETVSQLSSGTVPRSWCLLTTTRPN